MVVYTIYVIHAAKCPNDNKWIPEIFSKKPDFTQGQKCPKCNREYTPKELVDLCGGRVSVKEFDSDKLYIKIVKSYDGLRSRYDAEKTAIRCVLREQQRFEQKYGFRPQVQTKLG